MSVFEVLVAACGVAAAADKEAELAKIQGYYFFFLNFSVIYLQSINFYEHKIAAVFHKI